ncbi:hypothetical protein M5K25_004106 [Dendrobium thyrsiflorum]|uniref:Uncharacterized protein n=1 Tax=Dendrobium thyrsiflorum TaxID=117978 RepID=A0ABD0VTH9_DENTH
MDRRLGGRGARAGRQREIGGIRDCVLQLGEGRRSGSTSWEVRRARKEPDGLDVIDWLCGCVEDDIWGCRSIEVYKINLFHAISGSVHVVISVPFSLASDAVFLHTHFFTA